MVCALSVAIATVIFALSRTANAIDGDATFTGVSLSGGTCSFANYSFPVGIYGSGIGPSNWAGGGKCGACVDVDGPVGSVRVMVRKSFGPDRRHYLVESHNVALANLFSQDCR